MVRNLISSVWNTLQRPLNAFNAYQYYIYAEDEKAEFQELGRFAFESIG